MVKKILGIGLLVVFAGVLVAGAVNRTLAKSGEDEHIAIAYQGESEHVPQGNGGGLGNGNGQANSQDTESLEAKGLGRNQFNYDQTDQSQLGQGNGYRGGGRNVGEAGGLNQAVDWISLEGEVIALDAIALQVKLADGDMLELADRPWRFALESGFSCQPGDTIEVTGFYDEAGVFEVSQLGNLSSGQITTLRDEFGRPLWAGRNRTGA